MTKEIEFETYLRISSKIIGIYVFDKKKSQNLYFDEKSYEIEKENINFEFLKIFIEENIFKIEKLIGKFINNIFLIIENKKVFNLKFSLKKKNYEKKLNISSISNSFILEIEKVMERHQIKVISFICENYIKNIFKENDIELSLMAHKIHTGYNENEVSVVPKRHKKMRFFEKFFQLFS